MKIARLLLLSGLLLAVFTPIHAPLSQCRIIACNDQCGGPGTGQCVNGFCQCI
jgi:hypothetical protein